ncbi:hypothetical protein HYC85_016886 [Camellia sinensis]|uniref:Uncharacterized protein n=1 Tax=Camellia sinensis TaxID=4442 RepID=A0A7J7H4K9_CAMSI|nr:hypothetical protein HYC85_016886 [Camellia sinensis]
MAANNLTLIAIGEVTKQIMRKSAEYFAIKQMDYGRLLGLGTQKAGQKYSAIGAAKWGLMGWLTNGSSTPLIDVFTQASSDMVDFHLSVVFQDLRSEKNYLRIQDDTLIGDVSSVDTTTEKNLEDLVKVGERLLKKPISRVNLETSLIEPYDEEINEDALRRYNCRSSRELLLPVSRKLQARSLERKNYRSRPRPQKKKNYKEIRQRDPSPYRSKSNKGIIEKQRAMDEGEVEQFGQTEQLLDTVHASIVPHCYLSRWALFGPSRISFLLRIST